MTTIKPPRLPENGKIGVIAPASPVSPERLKKGVQYLKSRGFEVELGTNVHEGIDFFAGTEKQRLDDLHEMFSRDDIDAIICARGGYGTPRLLQDIDFELIKSNPKIFVGYSDLTAFQLALQAKTGLVSFTGPMTAVEFADEKVHPTTEKNFWQIIQNPAPFGILDPIENPYKVLRHGKADGKLIGGCLALVNSVLGTPFWPDFTGKILLIEDVGESPMRLDRYLNQLKYAGVFDAVKGVIIGKLTDSEKEDGSEKGMLNRILNYYFQNFEGPVINFFDYGHIPVKHTMPIGARVAINSEGAQIEIIESAVN